MTSEEKKSLKVINECTNDWKVIVQTALDSYVIEK